MLAHVLTLIARVCTHLACTRLHLDRPRLHTLLASVFTPLDRPTVDLLVVLHTIDRWPSASCACTSAMHSRNRAPESSARCQTAHPRNDAVLEVAPVLRLLPRCHLPLLHHADFATNCAETEPEPSSRTGRRCGEQRRTSQGETKLVLLRSKRPLTTPCTKGFRPNHQTTQRNELCIVTYIHMYAHIGRLAIPHIS